MRNDLTAAERDFRVRLVKRTENLVQITVSEAAARRFLEIESQLVAEGAVLPPGDDSVFYNAVSNAIKQLDNNRANGWRG